MTFVIFCHTLKICSAQYRQASGLSIISNVSTLYCILCILIAGDVHYKYSIFVKSSVLPVSFIIQ